MERAKAILRSIMVERVKKDAPPFRTDSGLLWGVGDGKQAEWSVPEPLMIFLEGLGWGCS